MKRPTALGLAILAALVFAAPVSAGPPYTGTTVLMNAPLSGTTLWVDASVVSNTPVVAYEYAIQNECSFPHRSGSSYQRDGIVYWTYQQEGLPHANLPIDLGSVPVGSTCKVFLVRNNTVVKGSTKAYTVS
jgi:hypothetical protein